jgi:glycosyltransferase involved in cell wall biosynthesis
MAEAPLTKQPYLFIPYWIADKISRNIADMIISTTSYLLNQMKINQKNVHVIPSPFNLDLINNNTSKMDIDKGLNNIIFASASNFNFEEKIVGLSLLIESIDKISKDVTNIKLLVFGNGRYLDAFKTKYAGNKNIVFMGFREDYRDFLRSVDIYVHISGLDNQPYALIEALMHGKVIICNNLGGIMETVDPNNNYIVLLNKASIVNTIQSVIEEVKNNPNKLRMKGIRNKEHAIKKYSSEVIATNYLQLYKRLLQKHS